ncbi:MAG: hypothetical protein ACTSU2_15985 [Promethearchaeota archaeon]
MTDEGNNNSPKKDDIAKNLESLISKVENKIIAEKQQAEELMEELEDEKIEINSDSVADNNDLRQDLNAAVAETVGKEEEDKTREEGELEEGEGEEEVLEEEESGAERNIGHLYTYCEKCQKHIYVSYDKSLIDNSESYPVYIVWVHGNPLHGLLVRIDAHYKSRGERVVHVAVDPHLNDDYS